MTGSLSACLPLLLGLIVATGCQCFPKASTTAPEKNATAWRIEMANAVAGGRALIVHIQRDADGQLIGFAEAPQFNSMPYRCDLTALTVAPDGLDGQLRVTVAPDDWVPADGQPVQAVYQFQSMIHGETLTGHFTGSFGVDAVKGIVTGSTVRALDLNRPARVSLQMLNALDGERRDKNRRASLDFIYTPLKTGGGRINNPFMGMYWCGRVTDANIAIANGRMTGSISVIIQGDPAQPDRPSRYTFDLDGLVVGDRVAGWCASIRPGRQSRPAAFTGLFEPVNAISPVNAVHHIELHDAIDGRHMLRIEAECVDSIHAAVFSRSRTFNTAWHKVDASSLRVTGNAVQGRVRVTVRPDSWNPSDGRPVDSVFQIHARVWNDRLVGDYQGRYGDKTVTGAVSGLLMPRPSGGEITGFGMKLEDALVGGNPWQNRCFANGNLKNGNLVTGVFYTNKPTGDNPCWSGALDDARIKVEGNKLRGTITGRVDRGVVQHGRYVITLRGESIGEQAWGEFETALDGRLVKRGLFLMGVSRQHPAGNQP